MSGDRNDDGTLAIVLAAGKGTRMKSELPKVLYPICGRPMIDYVLDALVEAGVERIVVVVGYEAQMVRDHLAQRKASLGKGRDGVDRLDFVTQTELLGTGHAVTFARKFFEHFDGPVFITAGDGPLIRATSIRKLIDRYKKTPVSCVLGSAIKENPFGLGRVLRDESGEFVGVVEEKDATDEQRKIQEVNMTYYVFRGTELAEALLKLRNTNVQKEYYLTDVPGILLSLGRRVLAMPVLDPTESLAVNTVAEAEIVEAKWAELRNGN